ncbi:MAG: DnaD domain protein [Chloroflexi bacterium AL-W]|nr:DnaD domain protein [Chloroflexi bacterium AL-N1]NOK66963.1 DnaD domain protein [Chloroflexi bacterium AL-N10]NOK74745.1 DnaD domain protein [Chloroflexi bacterium AL-N5]NOK81565.1 DnaD domain protein [Chloroflexi bacterium AL-W]NOK89035.1 DnaD domain protein [Chloroflexi bacterium AL-N15]
MPFTGFTTDKLVGLPPEFFSEVLPQITLPSELKVTLHVFYRLNRMRGSAPRRVSWDELADDRTLQHGLRAISKLRPPEELLAEGLDAAVRRTTLLHIVIPDNGRAINWYLVHTATNRAWTARIKQVQQALAPNTILEEDRPSIMTLYEQNIGLVTPLIVDELRDAEERYPTSWIEDAIREAVRANARSWRYVSKVLERWATHGRQHAQNQPERPIDVERYTNGQFGDLFRRGSDVSES